MKTDLFLPRPVYGCLFALLIGLHSGAQTNTNESSKAVSEADLALLKELGNRGVGLHDPSTIVKCKDEYWTFFTGRRSAGGQPEGISSYHSKDLINWERGPRVFTNAPLWAAEAVPLNRGMGYWAPDVMRVGDRYFLYYSVSSFGKNTSAIGLVTNPTLDPMDSKYHWTDEGIVIQSNPSVDFNAIDPAIFRDDDGSLWLTFGSFWSGIKLIQLDPKSGKRIAPDSPIHALAHYDSIEAPYIYKHDGYYYLFVNWGMCCRGSASTYNMRIGRSKKVTGPYVDRTGADLLTSGGTLFMETMGPFIGPGHAGIHTEGGTNWLSLHFYNGTRPRGDSMLAIRTLRWGKDGWPEVDAPKSKTP